MLSLGNKSLSLWLSYQVSFPLSHLLSYRFMSEVRLANIKAPRCVTSSDTGEKCQYKYQISSYHCFTPGEGAVVGRFWKK